MNHLKKHPEIQKAAWLVNIESLEQRAYFSGASFGSSVNTAASGLGISPVATMLADFNNDSRADLVVANSTASVSVATSNGDGTFAAPVTIPVLGTPTSLATGHFDTTGNLDIAVGTSGSPGSISIILGNGDGTFLPANDISALDNNSAIAVGDFNNDGKLDIITVSNSAAPSGNAMLLLGNGTAGAFSQLPFNLPFGSVSAVAVGDLNGDGNLDFVVANNLNNSVSVLDGNGDGTFQAPVTYAVGGGPSSIVISDVTGKTLSNGKPQLDIITGNETSGTVSYLANQGDGTFASAVSSPAGTANAGPVTLSSADFNSDGRVDLLAVMNSSSDNAAVLLGNGDGTFSTGPSLITGQGISTGGAAADVSGDGYADAVLTNASEVSSFINTYSVGVASSSIGLTAASLATTAGSSDTFTAELTPSNATGTVNFLVNGSTIGTANVVQGSATLTTNLNNAGSLPVTAVYSGDGTYAPSTSAVVTVLVSPTVVAVQTLAPVIQSSNLPAALVKGFAAGGKAVVQVTNNTAATVKGTVKVNIYASTNGMVDSDSVLVGTVKLKLTVKAKADFKVTVPLKISKAALADGSYRLFAQTIDPSNNLSTGTAGQAFVVSEPFVDLSENFSRLVLPASAVGGVKSSVVALVKITNSGNVASSGLTPVSLYASPDGTVAAGTLIVGTRYRLSIGVGKSVTLAIPLKAFPRVAVGVYSVVGQVTDPKGGVSTVVSTNTLNIQIPTVDLAGSIVKVPTTAVIGKKMTVSLDVTNNGNIFAKGLLQIAFSGSSASDGSNPVIFSTVKTNINLKPTGVTHLHLQVQVPFGTLAGSSYLIATVDSSDAFADPNPADNVNISLLPITLK